MFGKKRRKADHRITVTDAAGSAILDVMSTDFELPEEAVIRLSIEFFNDPSPCEIHRAAVRWRAVQQLVESCPKGQKVPVEKLDPLLRGVFPKGAVAVYIVEETP